MHCRRMHYVFNLLPLSAQSLLDPFLSSSWLASACSTQQVFKMIGWRYVRPKYATLDSTVEDKKLFDQP